MLAPMQNTNTFLENTQKKQGVGEFEATVSETTNCYARTQNKMEKMTFETGLLAVKTWHKSVFHGIDLKYAMLL